LKSAAPENQTVFLIGSRTGGPLIPLLGVKDELLAVRPELEFVIVGVRGGFEEKVAASEGLELFFLPEVKGRPSISRYGSSPPLKLLGLVSLPFSLGLLGARLSFSVLKSLYLIRRFRPALILSMSNFLSVPVIWAGALYNILRGWRNRFRKDKRSPVRIALHQLDIENFTVRLAGRFVDLRTGGFEEIRAQAPDRVQLIPNPVRYRRFDELDKKKALAALKKERLLPEGSSRKPLLLVFGGGSGALFINRWLRKHVHELADRFRILHLTGFLQEESFSFPELKDYLGIPGLTDLMPAALTLADVVLSRAGMSTISELLYLRKNAYLIPIPGGHQEKNAEATAAFFQTLEQKDVNDWANRIIADSEGGFQRFKKVKWSYFTAKNKYAYRDLLLEMLETAEKTAR